MMIKSSNFKTHANISLKRKIDFLTFIMSFVSLGGNLRIPEFLEHELFEVHIF